MIMRRILRSPAMNVLGHFSHLPRLVQDEVVDEIVVR